MWLLGTFFRVLGAMNLEKRLCDPDISSEQMCVFRIGVY